MRDELLAVMNEILNLNAFAERPRIGRLRPLKAGSCRLIGKRYLGAVLLGEQWGNRAAAG